MSVDFFLKGFVHPETDFNVANASARKILVACGVETDDLCGTLLSAQARQAARILSGDTAEFFTESGFDAHVFSPTNFVGPRMIYQGYDRERLARYAALLTALADAADAHETYICYG